MRIAIATFALLIYSNTVFGQFPKDAETGKVVYTDVIELPGLEQSEIFSKAKFWLLSTLKTSDNMTELENSEAKELVASGNLVLDSLSMHHTLEGSYVPNVSLNFKFIVLVKDGRAKYSVENFLLSSPLDETSLDNLEKHTYLKDKHKAAWKDRNARYIDRKIQSMINDFITSMRSKKANDW